MLAEVFSRMCTARDRARGSVSTLVSLVAMVLCCSPAGSAFAQEPAAAIPTGRAPWVSSRFQGVPDSPLPLSLIPAFSNLKFRDPMQVRWQPALQRYFVCELKGRIYSFPDDESVLQADLAIDLPAEVSSFDASRSTGVKEVYSFVFDPDFATNRFVYVCLILNGRTEGTLPDGSRISRFRVTDANPPRLDPQSELPILTWLSGGHNGCDLAFDQSGCLLISTGDATAPSPPDELQTGQNISDLLSSILRIDVRGATSQQPYRIPADNPFVDLAGARPEVWAYGFRNPWRISVDSATGAVHTGDVGWEKWELVHQVVRGGNYGWSVREGHELIQPNAAVGPTPILPPRAVLPHAEAASVTGGYVYRGQHLPWLTGQYLFGDWISGQIWSLPPETDNYQRIASGQLRVIAIVPDSAGEPLVVSHQSLTSLYRLVPNADFEVQQRQATDFPRRLSETGLFRDTTKHEWAAGVRPFRIAHPMWQDGTESQHAVALPDSSRLTVYDSPRPLESVAMFNSRLHYPAGAVLAKTVSLADCRIETQVLHFDGRQWQAYSYIWNQQQTDAELAPAAGQQLTLPAAGGVSWRIHSRTECLQCHNPWAETTLALQPEQLHPAAAAGGAESEWQRLVRDGYVQTRTADGVTADPLSCVRRSVAEVGQGTLEQQARSWLHANCSHCHQPNAGTGLPLSLRMWDADAEMSAWGKVPQKGTFGISQPGLLVRGSPHQSVLLYRVGSSSVGRMPHIGSREVDFAGADLLTRWIRSAAGETPAADQSPHDAAQPELPDLAAITTEQALAVAATLWRSHPAADGTTSNVAAPEQMMTLALTLARSANAVVSSLFEGFLPSDQRVRRLGPGAVYADVARLNGDAERGRALFFDQRRLQCSKCHQAGGIGSPNGPDLNEVGRTSGPERLFESITDPDREISDRWKTQVIVTTAGTILTGVVLRESPDALDLLTAEGHRVPLRTAEIEERRAEVKSLMPSGMAAQLTAQEMSDLLSWLMTLRGR
ncbi:MAG: PQQ-dependent sugar dehydrogenase [Planctomyces sp.]